MNINYKRNWILFLLPSSTVSFVKDEEIQLGSLFVIIPTSKVAFLLNFVVWF